MSSARNQRTSNDTTRSGARRQSAAFAMGALAILTSAVACASRDTIGPIEAMARGTSTPVLQSAIAMDKARLEELISMPGEEFSISFTQSPELDEIASRLPAFQNALRERERPPGEKARR